MNKQLFRVISFFILLVLAMVLGTSLDKAFAQESGPVQELTGSLDAEGTAVFVLPDLNVGQILYIYAEGTGGNLDPVFGVSPADIDREAGRKYLESQYESAVSSGQDPLVAMSSVLDDIFLAWDDDSGVGYDASLAFEAPTDGDYVLILASTLTRDTFGDYRLLLGLDNPQVLTGSADTTGDVIAVRDEGASRERLGIQEIQGNLDSVKRSTFYNLTEFLTGDSLDAYIETTSGDLAPILTLEDFGGKPVRISNFLGQEDRASLSYTFDERSSGYRLRVEACCEDGQTTQGDFRLVAGLNSPIVLEGDGLEIGREVVKEATEAKVGLKLQQITGVDQIAENFGIVATLTLDWSDPAIAFSPDECDCAFKLITGDDFVTFATENDIIWPEFTLFNQQGKRFTQNQLVIIRPDGQATYFERFSATLQAPDFDFRLFPFDTQYFFIRIDSLFPEEFFVFGEREDFSGIGQSLGEEEWTISSSDIKVSTEVASTGQPTSSFNFSFEAHRHLSFYFIRIFIPILVIISVSWATFFLKDYGMRVDVAAGNLLLFIAFNFTISGDLPRLGYLTFLDTIMISTFIVTALVVIFNVILKRLEATGRGDLALRLDRYTIWIYPLAYAIAVGIVILLFT